MPLSTLIRIAIFSAAVMAVALPRTVAAQPNTAKLLDRGRYLVQLGACNHCHTPGYFLGQPDSTRYLGGSDVGFSVPGLGVFVGPNLTPDPATGLGNWTEKEIIAAIQTGVRPDGRLLAPVMPWHDLASLTRHDVAAMVAYLRSLPPVRNKVPGPYGLDETPAVPVMKVVSPEEIRELQATQNDSE